MTDQASPVLSPHPRDALTRHFGFADFRPGQEAAIRQVVAGKDVLAVMPTGWGKSLIYQLAALMLPGTAIVISPLVALMKDQADSLVRRDIAAAFINSSLDPAEQTHRLRAMADGAYKIVLVAPERLRSRAFMEALRSVPVSLLAVDEAHCISQWGHDFRPDYLHIADLHRALKRMAGERAASGPPLLALTATATPRVRDDMAHMLDMPHAERVVMGFDRPNLTFEVFPTLDAAAKLRFVRDLLTANGSGDFSRPPSGIIYTGTITPRSTPPSAPRRRTPFSPAICPSSSRPMRLAWASTGPTCVSSCITPCPAHWKRIIRKPAAPVAMGCRRARSCYTRPETPPCSNTSSIMTPHPPTT